MLDVFARLTGVAYPWPKYAQSTVADYFGGMENVTASTLADWLPDRRAQADQPWYRHVLIPHEAAHQWFGNYVTPLNWAHNWLNEGFAQFMGGQYWGETVGVAAADEYYLDDYALYLSVDARRRMPLASMGSNNIYPKGSLVLRMLQRSLGPERFRASIHRFLGAHAFGNAASDDFRRAIADATGEEFGLVLRPVGLPGRTPRADGAGELGFRPRHALAAGDADAAGHASGRHHRPALHRAAGLPRPGGSAGRDRRGRPGTRGRARPAGSRRSACRG